ncbi:uncharacterized protein LOC143300031 [Babylonia areolata]|uniref:uncharacterized protein LOC143300031 n=1 Tax=Babylonia areolata TaxID=304850 RepID=UPI003FCF3CD5
MSGMLCGDPCLVLTHPTLLLLLLFSLLLPHSGQGAIVMEVTPYPARVYQGAPPGVAVLKVSARHSDSGQRVTAFRLERRGLSHYFTIHADGTLYTASNIDRQLGFVFRFFVFAISAQDASMEWQHVMIEVSQQNVHAPVFNTSTLTASLYRHSPPGTPLTTLRATDPDLVPYNHVRELRVPVRAVNSGSPALTSTATLVVVVDDVKRVMLRSVMCEVSGVMLRSVMCEVCGVMLRCVMDQVCDVSGVRCDVKVCDGLEPDTFCVSSSGSQVTLCWKNPMPGRVDTEGHHFLYRVQLEGQGVEEEEREVEGESQAREMCATLRGLVTGQRYSLQVTLLSPLPTSTPTIQLSFQKLGPGFSQDCVDAEFSPCHYLQPCENGARCEAGVGEGGGGGGGGGGPMDYTCLCQPGWHGQNCSYVDVCSRMPCQNGGQCEVTGHGDYHCHCPPVYSGPLCQNYNVCADHDPCKHGGICRMFDNGTHHCACPHHFKGNNCSEPDPCWPSPCGQGGQCVQLSEVEWECRCYHGYYGARCDGVDLCQSDPPCQHGATCLTTGNSTLKCLCPDTFTGSFCEVNMSCSEACHNNATCSPGPDDQYICTCLPGYHGDECQHYDRCHSDPCLNNGTCHGDDDQLLCHCPPAHWGDLCQHHNACLSDPCQDRGHCKARGSGTAGVGVGEAPYVCECHASWWGPDCQYPDPCQLGVCQNGATCVRHQPHSFRCECTEGQHGEWCQHTDPCLSSPCPPPTSCLGTTTTSFRCVCPPGMSVCEADTVTSRATGRFLWPVTGVGEVAEVTCPFGGTVARRPCVAVGEAEGVLAAVWGVLDDSDCTQLSLLEASRRLHALRDLTSDPASLGSAEVIQVTSSLEQLYAFTLMDREVAAVMLDVISNLCDVSLAVTVDSSEKNHTSVRLLELMDQYTADVTVTGGGHVTMTSRNIELSVMMVQGTSSASVRYVPALAVGSNTTVQMEVSITIPPEVFTPSGGHGMTSEVAMTSRLQLRGHRTGQLFVRGGSAVSGQWVGQQAVVSARVTGRRVVSLASPVVISFRKPQPSANYTCVFWDKHRRQWSTEGVVSAVRGGNWSVCQSSHLTSFALLLDPSPDPQMEDSDEGRALTYISFIGSSLSLLSLSLTILTYSLFRSLNTERSGRILVHLCLALSLLHLLFLVNGLAFRHHGNDHQTDEACRAVAVLLHYSVLTSLGWMVVEAVDMYQALVTVFSTHHACCMVRRCVLAWGTPALIVALTVAVDKDNYHSNWGFCFVSSLRPAAYYGSLVAPACGVLLVNCVLFVLLTRVLVTPRFQQPRPPSPRLTPTQVSHPVTSHRARHSHL